MQRGDRRTLQAGGQRHRLLDPVGGHVVVHHHVGAGHEYAVESALEHLEAGGLWSSRARDQDRLGVENHVPDDLQSGGLHGAPGLDDVGDHVGHPELDAGLHGTVEADHLGVDAALLEMTADHSDVRRGDALAGQVVEGVERARASREPEPRPAEAEPAYLLGLGAGVEQQVAAGDADVEGALTDVQRDVARPEVEELHTVGGVEQAQLLGVVPLAVAGLAQDLGGGVRQRSLVGDGDPQQGLGALRCFGGGAHGCPQRGAPGGVSG